MKRILVKIVGYEAFTSKKGTACVQIHTLTTLEKRAAHTECIGQKAMSFFLTENQKSKISVNDVGKELIIYTHFNGSNEILVDIAE